MEERLIELVKENVFLFDRRYKLYRNRKAKERKWKEIAAELCVPVQQVRGRWITLRDCYHREKKNRRKAKADGLPYPKKKWKYEPLLKFLDSAPTNNTVTSRKYKMEDNNSSSSSISEDIPQKRIRKSCAEKLDEEFMKAQSEMSEILSLAKSSFLASSSSTQLFFASIAASIEEADLSLDVISAIKLEVQRIVQEEILDCNSINHIKS